MKIVLLVAVSVLALPLAFAEEASSVPAQALQGAPKGGAVEVAPPVAEQATQGLFERVRGAYLRAVQHGNLAVNGQPSAAPVKR